MQQNRHALFLKREEALVKRELVRKVLLLTLAYSRDLLAQRDETVVDGLGAYGSRRRPRSDGYSRRRPRSGGYSRKRR
jgi:hypothetical protein